MKRILLTGAVAALAVTSGATARPHSDHGDRHGDKHGAVTRHIDLPDGWRPEGIAASRRALFVGSIPTGAVLRINPRTGRQRTVVPARPEHAAIGLKVHRGRLFVAGGPTGKAFVYDRRTGDELAAFQLAPVGEATFVNDVTLTDDAAYFTDSRRAVLYRVPLDLSGSSEIALPDIPLQTGNNLNGIAATRDGALLAIQGNVGALWRIDAATGAAQQVDLGGATLVNGDGLLLEKRRKLYVVQNRDNKIAVVKLSRDHASGKIKREITSSDFDVPTTVARLGRRLYLPNARFGTTDPEPAAYWVTGLSERRRHKHR